WGMTIGRANRSVCEMRASTCWNVDPCPTNCLGMLSRETGHRRVPVPPHMITGTIRATIRQDPAYGCDSSSRPGTKRQAVWQQARGSERIASEPECHY